MAEPGNAPELWRNSRSGALRGFRVQIPIPAMHSREIGIAKHPVAGSRQKSVIYPEKPLLPVENKRFRGILLTSYPPRECGVAKYSIDLAKSMDLHDKIISSIQPMPIDNEELRYSFPVRDTDIIDQYDPDSWIRGAHRIIEYFDRNTSEGFGTGVISSHEFGLDGREGQGRNYNKVHEILDIRGVPNISIAHTGLKNPNDHQKEVICQLGRNCDRLVVLTPSTKPIMHDVYGVDWAKLEYIPHGIPEIHKQIDVDEARKKFGFSDRVVFTTPGLVSKNKGIKYGLLAFAKFKEAQDPILKKKLLYLVAGPTHTEILKKYGGLDPYREGLHKIAIDAGLDPREVLDPVTAQQNLNYPENDVIFYNRFLPDTEFVEIIKASNYIVLPYLNPEQDSSGILAYSVGMGSVTVSTDFRGARDMLSDENGRPDNSGVLVKLEDDHDKLLGEIANALTEAMRNSKVIRKNAEKKGIKMGDSVVGLQMVNLLSNVIEERNSK